MESIVKEKLLFDTGDLEIIKGTNVSEPELLKFYKTVYPYRPKLGSIWKWLYRLGFGANQVPITISHKGQIAALVSGIPFRFKLNKQSGIGLWLMDYAVHPEYQRKGLGHVLALEMMNAEDVIFTCCNAKAIKIFRKLGWHQLPNSHTHYIFTRPAMYPKIRRKIPKFLFGLIDGLSKHFYRIVYSIKGVSLSELSISQLTSEKLENFIFQEREGSDYVHNPRDREYLKWRFIDSPDSNQYRVINIKNENQFFLIKLEEDGEKRIRNINVLLSSNPFEKTSYIKTLATLGKWAAKNEYNYILTYTNLNSISRLLSRRLFTYKIYQIYAFYSKDKALFKSLKESPHFWELMDSDFERYEDY